MGKPSSSARGALPEAVRKAHQSGLRVVPQYYKQGRKKPLICWKEYQERKPTIGEVEEMHRRWPDAMWCFIAGESSGIIVLDFDGPAGMATLSRLGLHAAVLTPSGGGHVYVKSPGYKVKIVGQGIDGFPGMEILGENHLATFYGTNHVGTYRKSEDARVYRVEDLPPAIQDLIESSRMSERELRPVPLPAGFADFAPAEQVLTEALATVSTGGAREQTGFWLATQLRDERLTFDDAVEKVVKQYQPSVEGNGSHPYTKQEAYHSVVSAFTVAPREPRALSKGSTLQSRLSFLRTDDQAKELLRQEKASALFLPPEYRRSLRDELEIEEPPVSYLVEQLHVEGANVRLVGKNKAGKTTLLANYWRSLLDDVPFLSAFRVTRPVGKVAYWNGELSERQFRSWTRDMGIKNQDQGIVLHTRGKPMDLSAPVVQAWTIEWLGSNEVEVWIIDPFTRFYFGEENSNTEVNRWVEALDMIKDRAGVKEVMLGTHEGRAVASEGEEHTRGASALEGWADALWTIAKDNDDRFFGAFGRDVDYPQQKLGYRSSDRLLSLAGGTRAEAKENRLVHRILSAIAKENDEGRRPSYSALESMVKGPGVDTNLIPTTRKSLIPTYITVEVVGNAHRHSLTELGRERLRLADEGESEFTVVGS